eukprot:898008-Prymnesium_polylepis.1
MTRLRLGPGVTTLVVVRSHSEGPSRGDPRRPGVPGHGSGHTTRNCALACCPTCCPTCGWVGLAYATLGADPHRAATQAFHDALRRPNHHASLSGLERASDGPCRYLGAGLQLHAQYTRYLRHQRTSPDRQREKARPAFPPRAPSSPPPPP